MKNISCNHCHLPMNGGVYRKANLCPHCYGVQDHTKTANNKPISPVAEKIRGLESAQNQEHSLSVNDAQNPVNAKLSATQTMRENRQTEYKTAGHIHNESIHIVGKTPARNEQITTVSTANGADTVYASADSSSHKEDIHSQDNLEHAANDHLKIASVPDAASKLELPSDLDIDISDLNNNLHTETKNVNNAAKISEDDVRFDDTYGVDDFREDLSCNELADDKTQQKKIRRKNYESVVLTTENARDLRIERLLDMVSAECVLDSNNIKSDFPRHTSSTGSVQGHSPRVLKDARQRVLDTLKKEAHTMGANGVIGLHLEYSEISSSHNPMIMVVATGTAVRSSMF